MHLCISKALQEPPIDVDVYNIELNLACVPFKFFKTQLINLILFK